MQRKFHSVPGLILAVLLVLLALSGAILSLAPTLERAAVNLPARGAVTVADLAASVVRLYPSTERIKRTPSGEIIVYAVQDDMPVQVIVDPLTGTPTENHERSDFFLRVADFHRSFGFGDAALGRAAAGIGALVLVGLILTGGVLLAIRMGGWWQIHKRARGTRAQRLHVMVSRPSAIGLMIAALSGGFLSLTFFEVIPNDMGARPDFPTSLDGGTAVPVETLAALQAVDLRDLRQLVFPYDGDPEDAFELTTTAGAGYVDQVTGETLTWLPHSLMRQIYEFAFTLHTGQGLWWFGLILGAASLAVPVLALTGVVIWWQRRRARPRIRRNMELSAADTVILVGSEGNTTWGFAYTLQDALSAAGFFVHIAAMNQLTDACIGDRRVFILTATYGDGSAPASAHKFLDQLTKTTDTPRLGVAVLGFGDREFDQYCAFAAEVEAAIRAKNWPVLAPMETINRQSAQEFSRWGDAIGALIGADLRLVHIGETPRRQPFVLIAREEFGAKSDTPAVILRFTPPAESKRSHWQRLIGSGGLPPFEAGDLLGIVPPGSTMPRYYSLGSATTDGFLEISVRRHAQGLCSSYLHDLQSGDVIQAFVRPNPEFHMAAGKAPAILIGAGCGVGPLAGFIRANRARRPIRLYFGARDPQSDFLYQQEMKTWLAEGKLGALVTAFSRGDERIYLQHKISADATILRAMVLAGAQIMVVGGREMARGVMAAMQDVIAPAGLTVDQLKAEGRYVEDIY